MIFIGMYFIRVLTDIQYIFCKKKYIYRLLAMVIEYGSWTKLLKTNINLCTNIRTKICRVPFVFSILKNIYTRLYLRTKRIFALIFVNCFLPLATI